ncbi:MAG: hypothetical protein II773_05010, partial [Oscillospiraceae bacterium]|nr:hypothetical protein [Oscillospiraceae bacterium]
YTIERTKKQCVFFTHHGRKYTACCFKMSKGYSAALAIILSEHKNLPFERSAGKPDILLPES